VVRPPAWHVRLLPSFGRAFRLLPDRLRRNLRLLLVPELLLLELRMLLPRRGLVCRPRLVFVPESLSVQPCPDNRQRRVHHAPRLRHRALRVLLAHREPLNAIRHVRPLRLLRANRDPVRRKACAQRDRPSSIVHRRARKAGPVAHPDNVLAARRRVFRSGRAVAVAVLADVTIRLRSARSALARACRKLNRANRSMHVSLRLEGVRSSKSVTRKANANFIPYAHGQARDRVDARIPSNKRRR
jgi:hypothetical protein